MKNMLHGKVHQMWCDTCGTLILGKECSSCHSQGRDFEINSPGDIRPAMGNGIITVLDLFERHFGTSAPLKNKAIFLNKVAGEDRADEVIAHGNVIGVMRFNIITKDFELELRQHGAELFNEHAIRNVITFGGMSGHLKGKSIPGENITSVIGEFEADEPVILRKGGKVGPGVALCNSHDIKDTEKAVRIKDLMSPSDIPSSPDSGREDLVRCNEHHLRTIGKIAASDIRSVIKGNVTVSFSGGKDSLAALAVTLNVIKDPTLIFVNTGIEFPETVEYVREFAKRMRLDLLEADAGNAFWDNVGTFGPPAKDFRWCCKVCKLGPITELIEQRFPKGTMTIEGNRSMESFARSKTTFVSKNPFVPNQTILNPIRDWSAAEVWGYIWLSGMPYNPMYDNDMERIGCYLCASSLSSEWDSTRTTHPELHERWDGFLHGFSEERGLPSEYVDIGLWRWKVLPPKMVRIVDEMGLDLKQKGSDERVSIKMLKGASPCAAGGYSMEAVVSIPRKRDFSMIEDSLRTIGRTRYSEEFEIAMLKTPKATAKMFGGGQVSVTSPTAADAKDMFERSVKALLRSQMCTECGICAKTCKRKAIRISNGFHTNAEKCISCGRCERSCMVMHYYDKMV